VKSQVYEGGIRVPFLLRWPGRIPAGAVYEHPVIALDILPTVLAASGTKADGLKLDGRDLVPFLSGKERAAPHEALFWRFGEQLAARKGDWKLVKTRNGQTKLFDLKADIGETKDVSAEHPKEFEELKALLEKWNSGLATPLWGPRGQAASNR
jgi:arylsulfatase A-like enzyme